MPDLDKFIQSMKKKGVKVGRRIVEGDHVRRIDFLTLMGIRFKRSNGNEINYEPESGSVIATSAKN